MKYYEFFNEVRDSFQKEKIIFASFNFDSVISKNREYSTLYLFVFRKEYEKSESILQQIGYKKTEICYQKDDFKLYLYTIEDYHIHLERERKAYPSSNIRVQQGKVTFKEEKSPFYTLSLSTMKKVLKKDHNTKGYIELKELEHLMQKKTKTYRKNIKQNRPQDVLQNEAEREVYVSHKASSKKKAKRYQKIKEEIEKEKNANFETLEIVSSFSEAGCLKRLNDPSSVVFLLPLELEIGDLKELEYFERPSLKAYRKHADFDYQLLFQKLDWFAKKAKKVRIWSSHISASNYLLFLFCCHYLKDKELSVLFSDDYQEDIYSIGMLNESEVLLLKEKEHVLTSSEKDAYDKEWKSIVLNAGDIRIMQDKKVACMSFLGVENILFEILKVIGPMSITDFCLFLMSNYVIDDISSDIYEYLIKRMIKEHKIVIVNTQRINDRKERVIDVKK